MSKKVLGITLAITGAITAMITVSFFKEADAYYIIRNSSLAVFFIGSFLIPNYSKTKNSN